MKLNNSSFRNNKFYLIKIKFRIQIIPCKIKTWKNKYEVEAILSQNRYVDTYLIYILILN